VVDARVLVPMANPMGAMRSATSEPPGRVNPCPERPDGPSPTICRPQPKTKTAALRPPPPGQDVGGTPWSVSFAQGRRRRRAVPRARSPIEASTIEPDSTKVGPVSGAADPWRAETGPAKAIRWTAAVRGCGAGCDGVGTIVVPSAHKTNTRMANLTGLLSRGAFLDDGGHAILVPSRSGDALFRSRNHFDGSRERAQRFAPGEPSRRPTVRVSRPASRAPARAPARGSASHGAARGSRAFACGTPRRGWRGRAA
jgi:hypothetical protein